MYRACINAPTCPQWVTGINIFFTVFALYGADVWELLGPPPIPADPLLHTISTLAFLFFCTEFAVLTRCTVRPREMAHALRAA